MLMKVLPTKYLEQSLQSQDDQQLMPILMYVLPKMRTENSRRLFLFLIMLIYTNSIFSTICYVIPCVTWA